MKHKVRLNSNYWEVGRKGVHFLRLNRVLKAGVTVWRWSIRSSGDESDESMNQIRGINESDQRNQWIRSEESMNQIRRINESDQRNQWIRSEESMNQIRQINESDQRNQWIRSEESMNQIRGINESDQRNQWIRSDPLQILWKHSKHHACVMKPREVSASNLRSGVWM
jgi:hypothetical protein